MKKKKGETITGEHYLRRLDQLEKTPGLPKKKNIFHQDNAPVHKGVFAMAKLKGLK